MQSNAAVNAKDIAYLLASVFYVVSMHFGIYTFDSVSLLDVSLIRTSFGNMIAAIVAIILEKTNSSWKASLAYMVSAITIPLLVSGLLGAGYGEVIFFILCAIMVSGFALPVARLFIPVIALLAQRKINRFRVTR